MTETNKKRVVKYFNILKLKQIIDFELMNILCDKSSENEELRNVSINCAIAEVEAMIVELEKSYNEWNLTDLQNELTELKSML
jgi:hypothetical protein